MASGDITAHRAKASDYPCAVFDGVDDKITTSKIFTNTDPFSISVDIYGLEGGRYIYSQHANNKGFILQQTASPDNFLQVFVNAGNIISAGTSYLEEWINVILTYDGTNFALYKNNSLIGSAAATPDFSEAIEFIIGNRNANDRAFSKGIKNLKIYDKVLSSAERAKIASGFNVTDGLVHEWKLQEDYNDSVGTAHGTNSGTFLTNTLQNKIKADANSLNLAAATDKIVALPRRGSPVIIGANIEA